MAVTFLVGGTRSGKSSLAVCLAAHAALAGRAPVVVIATGGPRDDEMAERIRRHRADRPAEWETIEEPLDLEGALARAAPGAVALVDCLTLWVANLLERGDGDDEIHDRARRAASAAAARAGPSIVVSNEVGMGAVPMNPIARRYADLVGRVNATWAEAADRAAFVVAGRALPLADLPWLPEDGRG